MLSTLSTKSLLSLVRRTARLRRPNGPDAALVSGYRQDLHECAQRMLQAQEVGALAAVLEDVVRGLERLHANSALAAPVDPRVQEAERRADELQAELDRVRALVREDALTGALNRRGLEEMFAREAARAERRGSPLTLCQLDLDDFKSINDHFGHASGDEVLTRFVCSVRRIVRPNDILARCGGDEFVLLLPDAAAEQAVTAVRRLQSEISSRRGATPRINLSFSCGIAIRGRREPLASLMQRADSAMYAAKRRGCNLFEIARPDPLPAPLAAA